MNRIKMTMMLAGLAVCAGCALEKEQGSAEAFPWVADRFGDVEVLRYQVPGFDSLTLSQKKLVYYLSQAALWGRDIQFDQHGRHNLAIRRTLEGVYAAYPGDREAPAFKALEEYLKKVWFAGGIHHHYSMDKFVPGFTQADFEAMVRATPADSLPGFPGGVDDLLSTLAPVMFDPAVDAKRVSLDHSRDLILSSANNFYEGVTEAEAEAFYRALAAGDGARPVSHGLNTKLVKQNGVVREIVWKSGGMYGPAIDKITGNLQLALAFAETPGQRQVIESLIDYYKTGDLKEFDAYNVHWVEEQQARVDFVNGFIEVYGDPLGLKGTWEAIVNFKDLDKTRRAEQLSAAAQWFEDHSPIDPSHKKKQVKGVSAKVITIAMLGGDCYPSSPVGINLPNADWIRKEHGSKSVTLDNIMYAHNQAALLKSSLGEFIYSEEELQRAKKFGAEARSLFVDMHECLGHGSGQLNPGVSSEALKNYASTLEEARADLFALYFMMDPKLQEMGLAPDPEMARASYDSEIRGGLMTQLVRVDYGQQLEEAHMRNRKLIAEWCLEQGADRRVIEKKQKEGKTYFVINDYERLRELFGRLLREVQRIKSEGDFEAGKQLVERYGVRIDSTLHREVLDRYARLDLAPYAGFVNPRMVPVLQDGAIVDIHLDYSQGYAEQMLEYSRNYSNLPLYN